MAIGAILDENGLSVKSYREIREELEKGMQGIFGTDLILDPSSPDGQMIDLFGYAYDEVKEALQGAISNLDVASAEGVFLDNLATLKGVKRQTGETDDSLRERVLSAENKGLATFDGMLTYLRDNLGPLVSLEENAEPEENSYGVPGHSFAVYIPESYSEIDDDDIAQAIWNCKPAGIKAFGTSSGTAKDILGAEHTVKFFRVELTTPFFMRVTVTEYTEETLPTDYQYQLKEYIANWAVTEYTRGKDIIPQRAIQAVYKVPGIDTVNIEVSLDGSEWQTTRIPVPEAGFASLPVENITIVGP
jgi:uncharacterized phage protein gp47/JayE